MAQHNQRLTPTGATFTIDSGSSLLDAGDGFDLVLPVLIGERDFVIMAEALWVAIVQRYLVDSER